MSSRLSDTPQPAPAAAARQIEFEAFREAFGEVPTPVAIVTAMSEDRAVGTTVSSFCSLSADPPLVLAALDAGSNTLAAIAAGGRFGVNVLADHQEEVARICATKAAEKADLIDLGSHHEAPRVRGAPVWLNCSIVELRPAGDHHILIGLIEASEVVGEGRPMLYHRRRFAAITPRPEPGR